MKRLSRFFRVLIKILSNFWVRLVLLFGVMIAICAAAGAFSSAQSFGEKITEVLTSGDILLTFLIAAVSLIVARITLITMSKLEDSYKLESNQKKIIIKYSDHKKTKAGDVNFYTPDGAFMYLATPPKHKRRRPHNPEKKHTEEHDMYDEMITSYMVGTKDETKLAEDNSDIKDQKDAKGKTDAAPKTDEREYSLLLPGVNVYANIEGNTSVRFDDSDKKAVPPDFVRENALALMEAHKNSKYSNNETIRLKDVTYDAENQELVLHTERTQYFDMLITNRCMDFQLNGLVSVRDVYESGKRVSRLNESQLSNQIGINGLIFTADGYLLLEKRGYKKVIWKGKLAQPISLAMKKLAVADAMKDGVLAADASDTPDAQAAADHAYASNIFKKIILKTIADNFGITEPDICEFDISRNLFGIAQDLLEGGKPNIYFYVIVKKTAAQCKQMLEDRARRAAAATISERKKEKELPNLSYSKLDSDYYLFPVEDIGIDFNYSLCLKARKMLKVNRKFAPMVNILSVKADGLAFRTKQRLDLDFKEECGEALLTCFYYMDICRARLAEELEIARADCMKDKEVQK